MNGLTPSFLNYSRNAASRHRRKLDQALIPTDDAIVASNFNLTMFSKRTLEQTKSFAS
jgi:hypothetical protein